MYDLKDFPIDQHKWCNTLGAWISQAIQEDSIGRSFTRAQAENQIRLPDRVKLYKLGWSDQTVLYGTITKTTEVRDSDINGIVLYYFYLEINVLTVQSNEIVMYAD